MVRLLLFVRIVVISLWSRVVFYNTLPDPESNRSTAFCTHTELFASTASTRGAKRHGIRKNTWRQMSFWSIVWVRELGKRSKHCTVHDNDVEIFMGIADDWNYAFRRIDFSIFALLVLLLRRTLVSVEISIAQRPAFARMRKYLILIYSMNFWSSLEDIYCRCFVEVHIF